MSTQVTNADCIAALSELKKLSRSDLDLPISLSLALRTFYKAIAARTEIVDEERQALLHRLGQLDEQGELAVDPANRVILTSENQAKFDASYAELMVCEWDAPPTIALEILQTSKSLTFGLLMALDPFLTE